MDIETFHWLLSDAGQQLLAEATPSERADGTHLRELERLRRHTTPDRAAAAYEIALLRLRARAKFSRAAAMYFTREALEQSSGETIARYRAQRYQGYAPLVDLACGIGADTIALAHVAAVSALDRDPLRLAMASANARAYAVEQRVTCVLADLEQVAPPPAAAIFFDPARREGGRRIFTLADYHPPVALIDRWRPHTPAIGVKVAPGVRDDDVAAFGDVEAEFISVNGELKEATLWFGPLAQPGRRATLLRTHAATSTSVSLFAAAGASFPVVPIAPPSAYLYEPDAAVIRAHLVTHLAEQMGAAQIDSTIAYLTSERAVVTPFARCWRVIEGLPFSLKRLRARLRMLDAGVVTVKKRGSPLDTDALARQLSGPGARALVVVLTIARGQPIALICEGPIAHDDESAAATPA